MKDYGGALKKLRKNFGYTQQQLADKLNVSYQTVSKWETGTNQMDLDTVRLMCGVFGISLDAFINIADGVAVNEVLAPQSTAQPVSEPEPAPLHAEQSAAAQPIADHTPQPDVAPVVRKPIEKTAAIIALSLLAVIVVFVIATIAVFAPRKTIGLGDILGGGGGNGSPVTVSFNLGGASGSMKDEVYKNGVVELPYCDGHRKGYTFEGWLYDGKVYHDGDKISGLDTSRITVTAKWQPIKYNIKFVNPNGGGAMPTVTAEYDKSVKLPKSTFTYQGAPMLYWYCVNNSERYDDCDTVSNLTWLEDSTITLEACWDTVYFNIKFDGNGGYGGEYGVSFNSDRSAAVNDYGWYKSGYTFVGWKLGDKIFYDGGTFDGLPYKSNFHTVTAVWKYNGLGEFYIHYKCNIEGCDGSGDKPDEYIHSESGGYVLRDYCNGKHEGYEFDHLYVKKGVFILGTYDVGDTLDTSIFSEPDIYVEITYEPIEFKTTVKYENVYGLIVAEDLYSWKYGTDIVTAVAETIDYNGIMVKPGYHVSGGIVYLNGVKYTGDMTKITLDHSDEIVVEVLQDPNVYTIVYHCTYEDKRVSYAYGEEFVLPTQPSDDEHIGYKFWGWYIELKIYAAGETAINITEYEREINAEAWWSPISYTVQFDGNGGSGTPPSTQTQYYDSSYDMPENPFVKEGYEFVAWESYFDGKRYKPGIQAQNLSREEGAEVTVKAVWVKYDGDGSEQSPYQIGSYDDLYDLYWFILLNDNAQKHYILTADINCEGKQLYPLYDKYSYGTGFSGVFDGNNHVISNADFSVNLNGNYSNEINVGLFGNVYGGTICNLGIAEYTINLKSMVYYNYYTVGPLAAQVNNSAAKIFNVWASGNMSVQTDKSRGYFGGLIGAFYNGTAYDCFSIGAMDVIVSYEKSSNSQYVGGLAGYGGSATITRCYADMNITATTVGNKNNGSFYIGGLLGKMTGVKLNDSFVCGSLVVPSGCEVGVIADNYNVNSDDQIYVCTACSLTVNGQETAVPTEYTIASYEQLCSAEWLKSNLDFDTDEVWQTSENGLPMLRGFAVQPSYTGGDAQ